MYIENWPWTSQSLLETVIKSCKFLKGIENGRIFWNFRVWLYSRSVLPLHGIWQNTCFLSPLFSCMRIESLIVFLYRKVQVRQNPYSSLFYTAYLSCFIKHSKKRNLQDCFQKHKNVWWQELLEIASCLVFAIFQELQYERMHYENLNNAIFNALMLELIVVNKKETIAQFTLED